MMTGWVRRNRRWLLLIVVGWMAATAVRGVSRRGRWRLNVATI